MLFFYLDRYECNGYLVFNYLSKIIYHNITPSADYDAASRGKIARKFF